jgi:hypothetical protein
MSVEKENVSTKCKNHVTKSYLADIIASDLLEKNNACHVLNQNVLKKCQKKIDQTLTKTIIAPSVTVQHLVNNRVFNWDATIFSMLIA